MNRSKVRSPGDALAYITDCTLATVSSLAMKKSRGKYEYERQISIAQCAYDWMTGMGVDFSGTRADDLKYHNHKVSDWAKEYEF